MNLAKRSMALSKWLRLQVLRQWLGQRRWGGEVPPGGRGGRSLRAGHGVGRSGGGAVKLGPGGKSGVAWFARTWFPRTWFPRIFAHLVSTNLVCTDWFERNHLVSANLVCMDLVSANWFPRTWFPRTWFPQHGAFTMGLV